MLHKSIKSLNEFSEIIESKNAALFYFSHEQCTVCKVLKPKIQELLASNFPKIQMYYCDTVKSPELAAQNSIFTVPALLVYFGGKETVKKSRNISIEELKNELDRPYGLIF